MSALSQRLARMIALCLGIALSALVSGCASLPGDVQRQPSHTLDDSQGGSHGATR